jgi:hypothetical protein
MTRLLALSFAISLTGCHNSPQDETAGSTGSTTAIGSTTATTATTATGSTDATDATGSPDSTTATAPTEAADSDATDSTGDGDACVAPTLRERPLPGLGDVRGAYFVDLDGNGDDELLALVPNALTAVRDDDSVVVTPLPCSIYEPSAVFPLHLDADPTMDILATRDGECIIAGLGAGDGTFTWVDVVEVDFPESPGLPTFRRGVAIDPDGDGIDALAAVQDAQAGLYSHFLPDLTLLEWAPIPGVAGPTSRLVVGQLDGSPAPDLLFAGSGCDAVIHPGPDFAAGPTLEGDGLPSESCEWLLGAFGGATQQPVTINGQSGVIEFWSGDPLASASVDYNGRLERGTLLSSAVPGDPWLLVANDHGPLTMSLLWRWANFPSACMASLPVPYGAFTSGDLDGDGIDELAVVGEFPGPPGLRLFSLDSP